MAVYCFVGPSLQGSDRAPFDTVTFLAPVAGGDLLKHDFARGDVVIIVDGLYHHSPAVRHKEILALIERGVIVVGAASMGALRATELSRYGMIGVGEIYQSFADGTLDGDDEVAILHASESEGYLPLSVALVELRRSVRDAVDVAACSAVLGEAFIAGVKRLPYVERTKERMMSILHDVAVDGDSANRLERYLRERWCHLKRDDALAALESCANGWLHPTPVSGGAPVNLTALVEEWSLENSGSVVDGRFVSDADVLDYLRLNDAYYPQRHREVALRVAGERLRPTLPIDGLDPAPNLESLAAAWGGHADSEDDAWSMGSFIAGVFSAAAYDWKRLVIESYRVDTDLESARCAAGEAIEFTEQVSQRTPRFSRALLPKRAMSNYYLSKWCEHDQDAALLARGFLGGTEFQHVAERFFLYDRYATPLDAPTS